MKLQIQRKDLLEPLQKVIGAIEKRQTMPMLANVLIETVENGTRLTATDMEIMLRATVERKGTGDPKAVALPGRKLLDIVKALPDGSDITLEADSSKGIVRSGKSRFTLVGLPAQDFPIPESEVMDTTVVMSGQTLKMLIDRTAFAMANQDVRYYLNGLLFEIQPEGVRAVATDGHRLTLSEQAAKLLGSDSSRQVIVPRKGVLELQRLLADAGDGDVAMQLGSKYIRVETSSDDEFVSKLIEGKFPDYQRVIPANANNRLTVSRQALREALQRAAILSNEKYRGIRLLMGDDQLTLQAHNSEQEEAEETLDVSYQGDELSIGFNVQYLLDVTNVIKGDEITLALKDSNSSVLLTDPADASSKYVVMPMRL